MKARFILLVVLTAVFCSLQAQQQNVIRSVENVGINDISIIELAGNGDAWVGSFGQGIAFYKASEQKWFYYNTDSVSQLKSDTITSINLDVIGGVQKAFIGTANGAAICAAQVWDTLGPLTGNHVAGIIYKPDSLWVLTGISLARFDSNSVIKNNYSAPLLPVVTAQTHQSQCGGFWAGTANNGCFFTSDGVTFSYLDTSAPHGKLVDNRINAITMDNQCLAKLVATKGGFSQCPDGGPPCQNFTTANGLPQNDISTVSAGCDGNVWLGTRDSGVVVFKAPSTFTRITTANGLPSNQITAIANTGCTTWVGMKDGNIAVIDSSKQVVQILSTVQNVSKDDFNVHVYPQPASGLVYMVFEKELLSGELLLTDLTGRNMVRTAINGESRVQMDLSALPVGIYVYRLYNNKQLLRTGKLDVIR
jgi:ligand-binding sensor domain-containing protein